MQTLHSHKSPAVFFSLLLIAFGVISGCSTRRTTRSIPAPTELKPTAAAAVNINTASASELEKLPHVGAILAERIVEHRKRYGPFRRPEHLLDVEGISEKRYRELKQFIDTK